MNIIPVLDIKAGNVVHARGGDRSSYAPIETPLSPTSDPIDVTRGLLGLHPFASLYIADLDAITGGGRNHDTICALRHTFPSLELWVDDGASTPKATAALAAMGNVRPVVGSETLGRIDDLTAIVEATPAEIVLSLDFARDAFLGPDELLRECEAWPPTVIAMTLAAVGSRAGPDLGRVAEVHSRRPDVRIIAAGGVRGRADLVALGEAGASGALVATALHNGTLTPADIREAMRS